MKIRIPFKLFGDQEGEIELDYPVDSLWVRSPEELEELATKDAKIIARYLGAFKDVFQRTILGYERAPGIEHVFQTLIVCETDDILRARIRELLRERCGRE